MTETLPPCPREDCDADPAWAGHHVHWLINGAPAQVLGGRGVMCEAASKSATRCYSARCPDCTYADVQEVCQAEPVAVLSIPCAEHDSK